MLVLVIFWTALKTGTRLCTLQVCLWNQSMLWTTAFGPAYTAKPQAAHKKSDGCKMSLIWKHGIDCHFRKTNHWLACCSFPLCHGKQQHAGKPLYFLMLWKEKTLPSLCSASHLIFSSPDLVMLWFFSCCYLKAFQPWLALGRWSAYSKNYKKTWEVWESFRDDVTAQGCLGEKQIHNSDLRTFLW